MPVPRLPFPFPPIPFPPRPFPPIPFPPRPQAPDLAGLRFRAETDPVGPAIALVWELADPAGDPDQLPLVVLRRERRFPGRSRRGVVPVQATAADMADGDVVYSAGALQWDIEETREDVHADGWVATTRQYLYRGPARDRVLVRAIRREWPKDGGTPLRATVRVIDRAGLEPGTIHYYTAFAGKQGWFSRRTQASALATAQGSADLFRLLPRVDQERDVQAPEPFAVPRSEHGRGQLERLVRVAQAHADMLLGQVDALHDVHDVRRADSRLLEAMAGLIGWRLKDFLDEEGQRTEIGFAPAVYRTTGTTGGIAAMVNRLTGWASESRDFVRNVLVSWDPTRVEQLPGGRAYLDGSAHVAGTPPALVTRPVPHGSVDTADAAAMQRLRDRDRADTTAYTFDCGRFDAAAGEYRMDDSTWYNRTTVGLYVRPPAPLPAAEIAETWRRTRELLAEFLPIQVRVVVFVLPAGP